MFADIQIETCNEVSRALGAPPPPTIASRHGDVPVAGKIQAHVIVAARQRCPGARLVQARPACAIRGVGV